MAKVLHWAASANGESARNRARPFNEWVNLNQGTITEMPEMAGPEGHPVWMMVSTGTGVFGKRDVGSSNTATDGPVNNAALPWTISAYVLGYGATIGRANCYLDLGDVVNTNKVTLTDNWQLCVGTGIPAGTNNYTFADCTFGAGAAGDIVFITQPQVEQRAWRSVFDLPNSSRTTVRASYVGDESGNGRTGAIGSVTSPRFIPATTTTMPCWDFSIDTHVITGPAFVGPSAAITVAAWFRSTGAPVTGYHTLLYKGGTNLAVFVEHSTGQLRVWMKFGAAAAVAHNSVAGLVDGNWHHVAVVYDGANEIHYKDGAVIGTFPHTGALDATSTAPAVGSWAATGDTRGQIADVRMYDTALSAASILDLAKVKGRITTGAVYNSAAGELVESPTFTKSLLTPDYNGWTNGSTGSEPGFPRNGSVAENRRRLDTNPWGDTDIVWESRADGDNADDGGWNSDFLPSVTTKAYRFSVWVRRKFQSSTESLNDGRTYLGLSCYDAGLTTNLGCKYSVDGVNNTNPYFHSGNYAWSQVGRYAWRLFVGVLYPSSTATGTAVHAQSGIYDIYGTKVTPGASFIQNAGTAYLRHRTYQYYSTFAGPTQQFYRPRVDVIDGTEPSIQTLLRGDENPNVYGMVNGLARVSAGQTRFDSFAESAAKVSITGKSLSAATLVEGL